VTKVAFGIRAAVFQGMIMLSLSLSAARESHASASSSGEKSPDAVDWHTIIRCVGEERLKLKRFAAQIVVEGLDRKSKTDSVFLRSGDLWDITSTDYELGDDNEYHKRNTYRWLWDGHQTWECDEIVSPDGRTKVRGSISASTAQYSSVPVEQGGGGRLDGVAYGDNRPYYDILLERDARKQIALQNKMEEIDGHLCYVIEAKCRHGYYKVWIDRDWGYNFRRLIVRKTGADLAWDKPLSQNQIMAEFQVEIRNSEISKIGDYYIATSGQTELRGMNRRGREEHIVSYIKRSNIDLSPPFETMGAFKMNLPDGTQVKDEDTGRVYVWKQGELVPREAAKVEWVATIAGTEAPEIDVAAWINCELMGPGSFKGKTVVIAFWDSADESCMEFVPFLNEVLIKYQGSCVEIVSVHSARADIDALKQLISDNAIKFRVALDKAATNKMYKGATFERYNVRTIPSVFVIDAEGKVWYQDLALRAAEECLKEMLK